MRRWSFALLLAACVLSVPGCELASWIANGFMPDKVKAQYKLEKRPTLVLVDDPAGHMGDPTTLLVMADTIKNLLSDKAGVPFIDQQKLQEYRASKGEG